MVFFIAKRVEQWFFNVKIDFIGLIINNVVRGFHSLLIKRSISMLILSSFRTFESFTCNYMKKAVLKKSEM